MIRHVLSMWGILTASRGEVRPVQLKRERNPKDVANRHEPGVMRLLPDNTQAAYESLPAG